MAEYPVYTAQDLSNFSGRPVTSYTSYADMACDQATLLFKMATCLAALPDDPDNLQLAEYAILDMADFLCLAQPYQEADVGPFQSEGIGSYNYSRKYKGARATSGPTGVKSLAITIEAGDPTGITWFDLAVTKMGVCDIADGIPMGGGVEVFEHDGIHTKDTWHRPDNDRLLGPHDIEWEPSQFLQPDPGAHLNEPGVPQYPTDH